MLSIQQLIKALRKLQSSNNTAIDLAKYLKNASSSTTTTSSSTAANDITTIQQAIVTSLLAQQESNNSYTGAIQKPNQQTQQEYENETTATDSSQNISHTTRSAIFSQISHSNDSGNTHLNYICTPSSTISSKSQQQEPQQQNQKDLAFCRSQQIHNFYQQQLLYFHTQQNSNLQAKSQQTQFSMSSLAAAVEPLALKHDEAAIATNSNNNSAATTNGTSCHDGKTTQGTTPTGKPCFNTGLAEILQFMELIGNLKHTKRTGWVLRDVNDCESISGHMYRMSMMTFLLDGSEGLNQIRCMELALVHDLAESLVGDITPFCGISKTDKRAMEFKAMDDICKLIEPRGKRIMELFEEYEHGESAESKFVKDLDRLDMVMQAFEYEKRDNCLLKHQEFFDSTEGKFNHPFVKKLVDEICTQRRDLAKTKGATPPPSINVPDMEGDDVPTASRNGHCETHEKKQTSSNSS